MAGVNQAAPPVGPGLRFIRWECQRQPGRVPGDPAHGRVVLVSHSCGDQAHGFNKQEECTVLLTESQDSDIRVWVGQGSLSTLQGVPPASSSS